MSDDGVHLLKASRLSLPAQAQQLLLGLITEGTYRPGEQLPPEKDLAARLGISRPTLREALGNLEQQGVLVRRHGIGTFVTSGNSHPLQTGLERLESVMELAARQHVHAQVDALEIRQEPASQALAQSLQVLPHSLLTAIRRVIVVDGKPVAYLADYAPAALLSPVDLGEGFNGSVLELLRKKPDLPLGQALANIVAVNADRFLCEKLSVKPGQALLLLEETLFDPDGRPIEFSQNYFVPDFFRFHVVRR